MITIHNIIGALLGDITDELWNKAMNEELDQIEKNDTWELVPRPRNKNVIGTKWVFGNKLKEEENESMEQFYKEEEKDEREVEGEDEEDPTEEEEQFQQVPPKTPSRWVQKNHPSDQIIENKDAGVETRRRIRSLEQTHIALLSTIEPNYFEESNKDEFWNKSIDEELDQIEKNDTWELVPRPKNKNAIDTKWVFKNKLNEYG